MPAATTKPDLIQACREEFEELTRTLDGIGADLAEEPFEDDMTIKDTVAHRAHWIGLFLKWWADGQAGREVHMPDHDVRWNDLRAYNTGLRTSYAGLTWPAARAFLSERHAELLILLDGLDDAALYGAPMIGGNGKWTAGRYAEAAGSSHYRSANKFIRKCLRSAAE